MIDNVVDFETGPAIRAAKRRAAKEAAKAHVPPPTWREVTWRLPHELYEALAQGRDEVAKKPEFANLSVEGFVIGILAGTLQRANRLREEREAESRMVKLPHEVEAPGSVIV